MFNNGLKFAWQRIDTNSMPVTMTYNITYKNLLYINAAVWFSSTASVQEQIIISTVTNSSCVIKATWNTGSYFAILTIGY